MRVMTGLPVPSLGVAVDTDQDTEADQPAAWTPPHTKPVPVTMPEPRTDNDIRQLATWLVMDRVYNMGQCPKEVRRLAFFLVFNGLFDGWSDDDLAAVTIFGVYGVDETAGMAVNGHPIFMQVRVWPLADYRRAQDLALAAVAVIQEWKGTVPPAQPAPVPEPQSDGRRAG